MAVEEVGVDCVSVLVMVWVFRGHGVEEVGVEEARC